MADHGSSTAAESLQKRIEVNISNAISPIDRGVLILAVLVIGMSLFLLTTKWYFLAPVPTLAVLLVFAIWQRPLWGFNLLIVLIPFEQFRTLSQQFQWFTISKLIGALLIVVMVAKWLIQRERPALHARIWPCLGLFIASAILATVLSDYVPESLNHLRQLITAAIFFVLAMSIASYASLLQSIAFAIIFGVAGSAMLSLFGYVTANPMFSVMKSGDMVRAVGGSNDPNLFALPILFALPLLTYYSFEARRWKWRIAAMAVGILCIAALIVSFSRGAALVLVALCVLLVFQHHKRLLPRKLGLVLMAVMVAIIVSATLVPDTYWERQRSLIGEPDESLSRRSDYIKVAWDRFIASPIIGHGPGTFEYLWAEKVYSGEIAQGPSGGVARHAHNVYLEIVVGMGAYGLIAYFCIILLTLRNFNEAKYWLMKAHRYQEADMVGAYQISFIVILIYFLLISAQYHKLFWLSLALSQILLNGSREYRQDMK